MKLRALLCAVFAALRIVAAGPIVAAEAPSDNARDYVRFVGDDKRGKLETAIITMTNPAGVSVELIGAVHIADAAYYKILNELFKSYESLLFELVDGQRLKDELGDKPKNPASGKPPAEKPKEPHPANGAKSDPAAKPSEKHAPVGEKKGSVAFTVLRGMMTGLGSYLRLAYQTDEADGVDYHAKNFVHADVSLAEFQRLQDEKGESFWTLFQKAIEMQLSGRHAGQEAKGSQLLLALLGDSSGIKVTMAKVLGDVESLDLFGGDSVIVGERNRVALEIFDREVKKGGKNLAIFYGAAHLPDMEKRLEARGFKRTAERWLTAWDIKPRIEQKSPAPPRE